MASSVNRNDILEALRVAFNPPPPPAEEGWQTMDQMVESLGMSEPSIRRRLRGLGDKIERQKHGGFTYYRLRKP